MANSPERAIEHAAKLMEMSKPEEINRTSGLIGAAQHGRCCRSRCRSSISP